MLDVATYAYHNCEFTAATRFLDKNPDSVGAAVLRIKCLCELDQAAMARSYAEIAQKDYPDSGALHYYRGMTLYLAGGPESAIAEAFHAAHAAGHPAGHLGVGFLAYVAGSPDSAMAALERASSADFELEHVRRLMMFQVALDAGDIAAGERFLEAADGVLRDSPSLLRALWGQLCWVRLLNACHDFGLADAVLSRLMGQLSAERTPRLHRNAVDLQARLQRRDGATEVKLPSAVRLRRSILPDKVLRKPTLSSLYHLLEARGDDGATKEDILRQVWDQTYNPLTHDDRLYKAIGRLRKLLENEERGDAGHRTLHLRGNRYVLAPSPGGVDETPIMRTSP